MREIKFRAWDNLEKNMLELVTVGCSRKDRWNPLYVQGDWINGIDHSDYIVMQHTGLTDANGKEIYEGDICLYDRNINDSADKKIFVVKYQDGSFFLDEWAEQIHLHDVTQELVEVIGNIFEDSHLLEVTK